MKILIAYATNSGSTFLVAQHVQTTAQGQGHEVVVQEINSTQPASFAEYNVVLLGSPSWDADGLEGQPHPDFVHFMAANPAIDFSQTKIAIFGLGDKTYHFFCGAVDHMEKYVTDHGGKLLTESLRIDRFFNDQGGALQQASDWVGKVLGAAQG